MIFSNKHEPSLMPKVFIMTAVLSSILVSFYLMAADTPISAATVTRPSGLRKLLAFWSFCSGHILTRDQNI